MASNVCSLSTACTEKETGLLSPNAGMESMSVTSWNGFLAAFKDCVRMLVEIRDHWNREEPSVVLGFQHGRTAASCGATRVDFIAPDVHTLLNGSPPGTFVVWIGLKLDEIVFSCLGYPTLVMNTHAYGKVG